MLDNLITSKTRIKLLVKFFLNAQTKAYLRLLESEFGESSNAIRVELNRFEQAGLLTSHHQGNRKYFQANTQHPYYSDINKLLLKFVGIETMTTNLIKEIGNLEEAWIIGDFARGIQSKIIDVLMVGANFNHERINQLIKKTESLVTFKIRYIAVDAAEKNEYLVSETNSMLVWQQSH